MTREQNKAFRDFRRGIKRAEMAEKKLGTLLTAIPEYSRLSVVLRGYVELEQRRAAAGEEIRAALARLEIDVKDWRGTIGAQIARLCGE